MMMTEVNRVSSVLLTCEHAAETIAELESHRWAGFVCYILEGLENELMDNQLISPEQREIAYLRLLRDVRQSIDDRLLAYSILDDEE